MNNKRAFTLVFSLVHSMGIAFLIFCAYAHAMYLTKSLPQDFFEGMSANGQFDYAYAITDPQWLKLKECYELALRKEFQFKGAPKIPSIFHLIWLGSPPPPRYALLKKQLEVLHPGWRVMLWTDKEAQRFRMVNSRAFKEAINGGEKSDILRYEILYRYGGVYVDGDFEFFVSLHDLHYCCDFYTSAAYDKKAMLFNALIGAIPGHPILKQCVEHIKIGSDKQNPNVILKRTGPHYFTNCFWQALEKSPGTTLVLPVTVFYPWPAYMRHNKTVTEIMHWLKPYSRAVHLWARSWVIG